MKRKRKPPSLLGKPLPVYKTECDICGDSSVIAYRDAATGKDVGYCARHWKLKKRKSASRSGRRRGR